MKNAKKRAPSISIRWQLMFFIGAMTLLTVGLIWGVITYALAPKYNATIRQNLTNKASAITAIFDQTDSEISSRDFGVLQLDDDFWTALGQTFSDKKINMDGYCVDFSDSTLRCLKAYESMFPCLLHESSGSFSGEFGYNLNTRQLITFRQELFEEGSLYKIVQIGSTRQMLVGQLSADGKYGIIVSTGMAQIATAAEVLRSILWPVALILLVLDLLFAMLFSRWFTRPVQQLSSGAKEIAAGNYDIQLPVVHHDEIGQLAEDFNHMAAEVKRSAQLEKDILANVSHDLRTPLTLIKGYAETVRDLTGTDAEKRTEQCNIIVDETDRLSALVNSVMELSKVQSGAEKPNLIDFDMGELCFEVAGRYDALCDQNHWHLELQADEAAPVRADPAMMERVLHNLLGNAFHHIGADGQVMLRVLPQADGCRVEIEDHGPGIPPEDLPYIFDRYYRARQDSGKVGTGLGLSITKAILQQHGFAFGVNSAIGQGSTFWFVRPRMDEKLNRKMDEQLASRVAELDAHNDETGDGKLDAADLKAQLNRIEAQLELQDEQNRSIMKNQRLRMLLTIIITVVLLVVLGLFWNHMDQAYKEVMTACTQVNELADTLQSSLDTLDPDELNNMMQDLPAITEQLKQLDVDSLNTVLQGLPTLMDNVNKLQQQVATITNTFSGISALFGK